MSDNKFISKNEALTDSSYIEWLSELKVRFRRAQSKAAVKVNNEMLSFYWSLGHDMVTRNVEFVYGKNIMANLSMDLRDMFPGVTGFSVDNLYFMKRWYLFYSQDDTIFDQLGQKFVLPERFALLPWRHHIEIIKKCKTIAEALFYIDKTIEGNWSRRMLESQLSSELFKRQGAALTNFDAQLPLPQGLLAQEILKDPYNFEFLTMKEGYDEMELEDALIRNITRFLLELGKGFAFVGRQMELRMENGKSFFPDLVFYHTKLKAYIIIELKVVEYIPEFAGKLNFYVTAATSD